MFIQSLNIMDLIMGKISAKYLEIFFLAFLGKISLQNNTSSNNNTILQGWALRSFAFRTLRSFAFKKENVTFFSVLFSSFW